MSNQDKPEQSPMYGKPWKVISVFDDFEQADKKRQDLSENKGVQVKVRRSAEGKFSVRLRPVEQKESSRKKNKKQNKAGKKSKE